MTRQLSIKQKDLEVAKLNANEECIEIFVNHKDKMLPIKISNLGGNIIISVKASLQNNVRYF